MGWRAKKILAADCETDPFRAGRVPKPFLWGIYDGKTYTNFATTAEFVAAIRERAVIVYAHNGGKFDFMYLLPFVGQTKAQIINGRIVSMMLGRAELRDSFACVPLSMKEIQKEDIEMWKLEADCRDQYREEILFRNRTDCIYLYNLMIRYREIAGTQKTIASNALAFAKRLGVDMGKTNHAFDQTFRPFYSGGRCECFQPGTHRGVKILDIHSAYPYAMTHDHATGAEYLSGNSFRGMMREQIQRSFVRLECTSRGGFPKRNFPFGLSFPHEYDEYFVSGWEYLTAKELGLIANEKLLSVLSFEKTINFSAYVNHWYKYKLEHPKFTAPIDYTIGKIMMNSLYGKAAQNPANYFDYEIKEPGTEPNRAHGWELYSETDELEFHRRPSLWKYQNTIDKQSGEVLSSGHEWKSRKIYKNVATGASITGFTRAHLLRAMHTVGVHNVIYCDTDSIILRADTDVSGLSLTPALGDWELEENCAPVGHFAGKKLYAVKLSSGKDKIACKGSRLTFNDLAAIVNGEKIVWNNPAPSFSSCGKANFIVREIQATHPVLRKREQINETV